MTHYGNNKTHTCDAEEHDWKKTISTQSVSVVLRDGEPCLKCYWSLKYECTQTGEKYMRNNNYKQMQCEKTKEGSSDVVYVPISELERVDE